MIHSHYRTHHRTPVTSQSISAMINPTTVSQPDDPANDIFHWLRLSTVEREQRSK